MSKKSSTNPQNSISNTNQQEKTWQKYNRWLLGHLLISIVYSIFCLTILGICLIVVLSFFTRLPWEFGSTQDKWFVVIAFVFAVPLHYLRRYFAGQMQATKAQIH